ncbi:hypothetical protein [Streptomyces halstedii]|uniref:hypothetical protein n=1 Tax=Streptomyces halstedii TaxID=1944 RepID=UPI0004C6E89F
MTAQTTNRAELLNRARKGNRAVKNTAAHLPDLTSAVSGVAELADQLPDLDDVREVSEDDRSPLDETEARQRAVTERVIHAALAAGDAAIWVIGKALTVAAKGKFHRDQGMTFDEYARAETGKSPAHARRWMDGAPLALAVAAATSSTPPEGHVRPLRKIEKEIGTRPAIELYRSADKASGEGGRKVTGAVLVEIRKELPAELPENAEEAVAVVREAARRVMTKAPASADSSPNGEKTEGADEDQEQSGEGSESSNPPPVRVSALVPASVAATLEEWAGYLSLGHRVPLDSSAVLAVAVELAVSNGGPSLQLLSERIEAQHAEHISRGVDRFEWRPSPRSKSVRTAERRLKGHPATKRWAPRCTAPAESASAPPCDELVIWKVDDEKRGTSFYCDNHLPAEDTPPGIWRD